MIVKDGLKRRHYFRDAGKYFVENGISLVLVNLIPCLLLPFTFSPSGMIYMLFNVPAVEEPSLKQVLAGMFDVSYSFWYIGLIGFALLLFTVAITFGAVDRHMRVGELTFSPRRIKSRLNYNITTSVKCVFTLFLCVELSNLLVALMDYMWMAIFESKAARLVFCTLSCALAEILFIFLISVMLLWAPYMMHVGMKSSDAFKAAWRAAAPGTGHIALCVASVILPFQALAALVIGLGLGPAVRTLADGLLYAFFVPYYITLMYTVFYDVTGTERMDGERDKAIWKK